MLLAFALDMLRQDYIHEETSNALSNSHLEWEKKSEKDGIIKRKSNLSFEAFIDLGKGAR